MKNIVEDFQSKCKNCGHTKGDHYSSKLDCPPFENKKKGENGVCGRENCNCKKFEPKENMDNQMKNSSKKLNNLRNLSNPEENSAAIAKIMSKYGITEIPNTGQPEPTNKLSVKFLKYPKKPEKK